jgi:hypothetical protein
MKRTTLAMLFLAGCAHTRAEELTVEEHQAEARAHTDKARQEEAQYQEGNTVRFPARSPFADPNGEWVSYNPTEQHLDRADRELRAAAAHSAAAKALASFEDKACAGIPGAERAACPLLASVVTQVQETRTGLRLVFKETADVADIHRRLSCHLAYAQATGFDRPSCPLFVKGMAITLESKGVLAFTAEQPAVARRIQEEARRVFTGATAPVSARPAP